MGNRFYYGMPSTQAFQAMNTLDDDVQAKSAAATTAAQAAASSASQAANARDAALAAWQASTAPNEQLAALSKQFHTGAVVDVFLYDTSRDSDGGAWRKRCRHTSWENETLVSGKWLGQNDNTVAAVAAGGVNGDYFQAGSTYSGGAFFQITNAATNQATQVYRGSTREFPALALIVVEAARVVIYDATQPTLPMWMVFIDTGPNGVIGWSSGNVVDTKAVAAANGSLVIVGNSGGIVANFISDDMRCIYNAAYSLSSDRHIVSRNAVTGFAMGGDGIVTVSYVNSDVSITVLPDAPMDAATGLPAPTIAFATQGGVSVIKHDGTSVSSSYNGPTDSPSFTVDRLYFQRAGAEWGFHSVPLSSLSAGFSGTYSIVDTSAPSLGKTSNPLAYGRSRIATRGASGMCLTRENQLSAGKSMVAYIANSYSSGWQVGDSRGAWLASSVAGTASGAELVTNGTFSIGTSAWTSSGTMSIVSGALRTTCAGPNSASWTMINTTIGARYRVVVDIVTNSASGSKNTFLYVGSVAGASDVLNMTIGLTPVTGKYAEFTAISSTTSIMISTGSTAVAGDYFDIDNVSVRQIEDDRSVKAFGLGIFGGITKAPVASGAQLVGYTNFTTSNYLEQPFSGNLDFDTGDFCVMGWAKPNGTGGWMFSRCLPDESIAIQILQVNAADFRMRCYSGGVTALDGPIPTPPANGLWSHFALVRESGKIKAYLNGSLVATSVMTNTLSANVTTTLGVRRTSSGINGAFDGALALWRAGATAPSADQIAQIYRDELALFQPGAQCSIAGDSAAVTSLSYDPVTDLLHVGTDYGYRSAFNGLLRVESDWPAGVGTGGNLLVSAFGGAVMVGGNQRARFSQPAIALRDELRRKDARGAAARDVTSFDFDSTAGMTDFTLPPGWSVRDVLMAGVRKRQGATKDYVVNFDGYRETARFAVSPGAAWVQVVATRSGAG